MTQLDISQAKADISKLLDLAIKGEEIVITQSIAEDIPIISVDSAFDKYEVTLIN